MDATKLLKDDHDEVRALFKEYEKSGDRALAKREELFEQIRDALTVHAEIEEEIFYPAVKAARSEDARDEVREAVEEHRIVKTLLAELDAMKPGDEQFDAKMTVLQESVEHHADEEEKEMFKQARKNLSKDRLEALGEEMEARKGELVEAE
ncbi:MAG TPA: hemerythrin domain-containing protein [Thermoanaerobaculia bacterium]|nr:hemerythrin domain-containing protein [Thermoanaerobaculia bacterium]